MTGMVRTTITIDEELASDIDAYAKRSGKENRSEAIRDLVRRGLSASPEETPSADCIGIISYAIDQKIPGLAKRVRTERLEHHNIIISTLGFPVDHSNGIDVVVMRAKVSDVSDYASKLFLERGVRHGSVSFLPISHDGSAHQHHDDTPHSHVRIQNSF